MKARNLFLIFTLSITFPCFAQGPEVLTPVSPDAAALGKFGEVPVNLSTGIPNVSIPIYEIKQGKIIVPISLMYHAGGIKVEEVASSAGLGWAVNAGGVISRACRGLPDEFGAGIGFKAYGYKVNQVGTMTVSDREEYLRDVEASMVDAEPDIFYYNFGNYSGKFFFQNSGEIVTSPKTNLKITYVDAPKRGWEIIVSDGTKYIFNEAELTTTEVSGGDPNQKEMETSWYLKSITDIHGSMVTFNYEEDEYGFESLGEEKKAVQIMSNGTVSFTPDPQYLWNVIQGKVLSNISFKGGEIDFIMSSSVRSDIGRHALHKIQVKHASAIVKEYTFNTGYFSSSGPAHPLNRLKLESLTETAASKEGAKYLFEYSPIALPSRLSFSQDHWGYFNGAANSSLTGFEFNAQHFGADRSPNASYTPGGSLIKITYPTGGTTAFEYENNTYKKFNPNYYGNLTYFTSVEGDNYYGNTQTDMWFEKPFTISSNDLSSEDQLAHFKLGIGQHVGENVNESGYYISYFIYDNNNVLKFSGLVGNDGDLLNLPQGSYKLKIHISLDVGGTPEIFAGFTLMKYEFIPSHISTQLAGGLRIKKITNIAYQGANPEIKKFNYNVFGQSLTSGTHGILPSYTEVVTLLTVVSPSVTIATPALIMNSSSNYPLSRTFGSHVVYGNVTSELGENSSLGKTESTFTNYDQWPDIVQRAFPYPSPTSIDFLRGLLVLESRYKKTAGGFEKVYEEENTYQWSYGVPSSPHSVTSNGIKIRKRWLTTPSAITSDFNANFEWLYYTTLSEFLYLKTKKSRMYNSPASGDFLETITNYEYSDTHLEQSKVSTINSKGEQSDVIYKYPHDFQSLGVPNIYNEMVNRHIWSPVIEQSLLMNTSSFIKSSKTNYNFFYGGIWGSTNPSKLILPQTIESKTLTNTPNITSRYHSYDNDGNITVVSEENNIEKVFIWGYDKVHVVAEISGVSYSDATSILNMSVINNPVSDAILRTELNKIRTAYPNARVTSYTFKPLVGMTSQTDLNNRTIYYEYDDFGRLFLVRDQNNHVVKKICYNYQGQIAYCP